jgi:hypothetical protein
MGVRLATTTSLSPATTLFESRHTRDTSLGDTIDRSRSPETSMVSPSTSAAPTPTRFSPAHRALTQESRTGSQVFVVHHDAGRPPVTVYAADGTEIVELPPVYIESDRGTAGPSSDGSGRSENAVSVIPLQERRQIGATPTKAMRRVAT